MAEFDASNTIDYTVNNRWKAPYQIVAQETTRPDYIPMDEKQPANPQTTPISDDYNIDLSQTLNTMRGEGTKPYIAEMIPTTDKSMSGYLGPVKSKTGRTMTEFSMDLDVKQPDGSVKEMRVPSLVPGLNQSDVDLLAKDEELMEAPEEERIKFREENKDQFSKIFKTASTHAERRLAEGKSVYYQNDEPTSPLVNYEGKDVEINNNDKFYSLVKTLENSVKSGFDKETNTWKSHKSLEGGRPTIAWGHKLTPEEAKGNYVMVGDTKVSLDTGLTNEQADTLFKQDMDIAKTEAKKFIGEGFDGLSNKQQLLATELFYNLGANKAKQYKNFKEKILAGDESFINEIDRGYKDDKGQRKLLTDRTDPLKEWYVSD